MKLPRDISGRDLAKVLGRLAYEVDHQTGSHIRLRRLVTLEQHLTIPNHDPIKVGTLAAILKIVTEQTSVSRDELIKLLLR